MDIFLAGAIIFAIGVVILVSFSLARSIRKRKNDIWMRQQSNHTLEYIEPWEQEKEVVSSEKIKSMKEKELAKNAKEDEFNRQKKQEKAQSKEQQEKKIAEVLKSFEEVRAGEVQRTGQEQFNLRKDEPSQTTSNEENWWR